MAVVDWGATNNMVYHSKKKYRTQFRKLPSGQEYWLASNITVAPSLKVNRTSSLKGMDATGAHTTDTVSPTTVGVIKVPRQWTKRKMM